MPKLIDLDGRFLKLLQPDGKLMQRVDFLAEADGVIFQCPKCAATCEAGEEDGRHFFRGAHSVICWFVGKVGDDVDPKPGRWVPSGTGLDDLTFVGPAAASVLLTGPGCGWHGFVKNGIAE